MVREPGQVGVSADLLIAGVRSRQAKVMGDVVDASLKRMAENRERRAEERAKQERAEERLRAIREREHAEARDVIERHEKKRATLEEAARRGDDRARVEADRERGKAEQARVRSRLDLKV
ncbi:MAG: hypothetical protein H6810_05645 [Phycisphaeraceae bacterium]|nr:MAG: hypothetical protein H6810_05645 [Phycisphaeraceae bacterium]